MRWRFKFYQPEDGECQPQAWYERQTRAVKGQFDAELVRLSLRKNAPETASLGVPGYSPLLGIEMELEASELPDGVMKVMAVGSWQADSCNFVILLCCEEVAGDYDPPLYQALELRRAWEDRKGRIYDHIAADEPID
jgi:hypothetical protein